MYLYAPAVVNGFKDWKTLRAAKDMFVRCTRAATLAGPAGGARAEAGAAAGAQQWESRDLISTGRVRPCIAECTRCSRKIPPPTRAICRLCLSSLHPLTPECGLGCCAADFTFSLLGVAGDVIQTGMLVSWWPIGTHPLTFEDFFFFVT